MTCVVVNAAKPRNVLLIAIIAANFSLRKGTQNKSSFTVDDSIYKIIEILAA